MIERNSKVEYNGQTYVVEFIELGFLGGKYLNLSTDGNGFPELFGIGEDEVTVIA